MKRRSFSEKEVVIGEKQIELVKSELPVMFIETAEEFGSFADLLNSDLKETYCYGNMYLSVPKEDAEKNAWAEEFISEDYNKETPQSMSLHPRGNMTWIGMHKKPFALRLEHAEDLLGMGKNKKWNLLADSQDKSLMKNDVFLELADELGLAYTPKSESISLYVDGNYQGVYLLTTKISVDKNRINLKKDDFLLNWGAPNPKQPIYYKSSSWFADDTIQEPYAELVWPENDVEIESKKEIVQKFIAAIEDISSDEYLKYMDMDSMIKYYWVQEVSMNQDAFFRSVYSYYDADTGKIHMGPVWDMDLTLGTNVIKQGVSFKEAEGWKVRELSWYAPLFQHEEFRKAVKRAYFTDGIRENMYHVIDVMESNKERLGAEGDINYRLWIDEIVPYSLDYGTMSFDEHVDAEIEFYKKRIAWIDEQMQKEDW